MDVQLSDFISILNVDKEKHYKNFEDLSNSEPFAGLTAGSVVVRVSGDDSSTTQVSICRKDNVYYNVLFTLDMRVVYSFIASRHRHIILYKYSRLGLALVR